MKVLLVLVQVKFGSMTQISKIVAPLFEKFNIFSMSNMLNDLLRETGIQVENKFNPFQELK